MTDKPKKGLRVLTTRRELLKRACLGAGFVILLGITAGCAGGTTTTTVAAVGSTTSEVATTSSTEALGEPLKIGLILPLTGRMATAGADIGDSFKLYLKEIGSKVGNRPIELVLADDKGVPANGPIVARELIENSKVDVLSGGVNSGVVSAIRDYIVAQKIPMIVTTAGARGLTSTDKSPYIFRVGTANGQQDAAGAWYAYNKLGWKKIITLHSDYLTGREYAASFKSVFEGAGGKIVDELFTPLDTTDYGPILTQIAAKAGEIDAVNAPLAGTDAVRLVTQWKEFGLQGKLPLYVFGDTVDESLLPAEGDAAAGVMFYGAYLPAIDNPANVTFKEAFKKEYGKNPGVYNEAAYVAAKVIISAVDAVGGDLSDKEAFLAAIRKTEFEAPRGGTFKFDANQNTIRPIYIGEVKMVDGQLARTITDVIPDVGQDWTGPK